MEHDVGEIARRVILEFYDHHDLFRAGKNVKGGHGA